MLPVQWSFTGLVVVSYSSIAWSHRNARDDPGYNYIPDDYGYDRRLFHLSDTCSCEEESGHHFDDDGRNYDANDNNYGEGEIFDDEQQDHLPWRPEPPCYSKTTFRPTRPWPTRPCPTRPWITRPRPTRPRPTRPWPTRPWPTRPWPTRPWPTRPCPTRPWPTRPTGTRPPQTTPRPTRPYTTTGKPGACIIPLRSQRGLPSPDPLFLRPGGNHDVTGFLIPQIGDVIYMDYEENVLVACPGLSNQPNSLVVTGNTMELVSCVSGQNFRLRNGTIVNLSQLRCYRTPTHMARYTNRKCGRPDPLYNVIEIGYLLSPSQAFYKMIEVCYDKSQFNPLYSNHMLLPQVNARQAPPQPEPPYLQGPYYNSLNVTNIYTIPNQQAAFKSNLDSEYLAHVYIRSDSYLEPNRLAPREDFIWQNQQRTTYWYVNTAPQYHDAHVGNWASLENSVRNFATSKQYQLLIYTGTHGITTLTDEKKVEKPMYLGPHQDVRVPHMFWKLVWEPKSKKGVVFITLNNPFYVDCNNCRYKLCDDVCNQISWIHWKPNDRLRGLSYCCRVEEISQYVFEIPHVYITGLLTE